MEADVDRVFMAIQLLTEGMGVNAACRVTGLHKSTVLKSILIIGEKCQRFLDAKIKDVSVNMVSIDEQWQHIGAKERNKGDQHYGDSWFYCGIDHDSRMILAHAIGRRTVATTRAFLGKLRRSIAGRCQINADGFNQYRHNIPFIFHGEVDYGMCIKSFSNANFSRRYSPGTINSLRKEDVFGSPDMDRVSTAYSERFNLAMRNSLRRFTRLTSCFSKSFDHHCAMVAIFVAKYNFCTVHGTIKQVPAVAAGVTNRKWKLREIAEAA